MPIHAIRAFSGREWLLLLVLLAVQFCHIVDFVLLMPLAPMLMRSLSITAPQFALLVSAYTLSAAVAGLVAAFNLDRFDRKRALLVLLAGFGVGTMLCGLANSYATLLAARAAAGAFGGILASLVFAIVGDQIPAERRGRAMGIVMAGFSAASVLGLPLGLTVAARGGWQIPFQVLAVVTAAVFVTAAIALPRMRGHLATPPAGSAAGELWGIAREAEHLKAFALSCAIMLSGFVLFPFMSAYLTSVAGLPEQRLDLMYLVGGIAALLTGPTLFGPLADRIGHGRLFIGVSLLCIVPIVVVTNLPASPIWLIIVIFATMMVMMTGRMIGATALITGVVDRARRGRFMSLNASVQHGSAAIATALGGLVVGGGNGEPITGYANAGIIAVLMILVTTVIASRLRAVPEGAPILPDDVASRPVGAVAAAQLAD